jgi:hypothetical protein
VVNPIEVEQFVNVVAQVPFSTLLLDYDGLSRHYVSIRSLALPYPWSDRPIAEADRYGRLWRATYIRDFERI